MCIHYTQINNSSHLLAYKYYFELESLSIEIKNTRFFKIIENFEYSNFYYK